jgi:hypothetical protein
VRRKTLVSRFVVERLHPALRDLGFRRTAYTWNRDADEFIQVINVQADKVNMPGIESFTVNLGVYWDKAYRACWQRPSHKYAREVDCIVRSRIGRALAASSESARDVWWNLATEDDLEGVGADVPPEVVAKAVPFLDRFRSLEDVEDFLAASKGTMHAPPVHLLYLAVLRSEIGDRSGAMDALKKVGALSESARSRAEGVAKELGLELVYA